MILLLLDEGWDFEAVYVDHGCDWPETRKFVYWLSRHTPITILYPHVEGHSNIYDYFWHYRMVPFIRYRLCTDKFKLRPIRKYCQPPAFELIGIDAGEDHRAKIRCDGGLESRYPLIEYGIDRRGCVQIIKDHGIPVPLKSGCFFCPMQPIAQWKLLRRKHPDLFCKVQKLEDRNNEYRRGKGKEPFYLYSNAKPLGEIVDENQGELFKEYEYPPCRCEL
jgi:hypothetical protein